MNYDYTSDPYEIGEFTEDGAMDELSGLCRFIVARIEAITSAPDFSSIELSAARANIRILVSLLESFGDVEIIEKDQVLAWTERIDGVFTDPKKWGFTPWPDEIKAEWRAGCARTIEALTKIIEQRQEE